VIGSHSEGITQLQAQGPNGTCLESNTGEDEDSAGGLDLDPSGFRPRFRPRGRVAPPGLPVRSQDLHHHGKLKENCFKETCSGSEAGSY